MYAKDDERVTAIINNLSSLILYHATLTASEQYSPSQTPDESDDTINQHKKWVVELRDLRTRFENLITGIL